MRQKIVAGNWKMNGSAEFAQNYLKQFIPAVSQLEGKVDIILAPPAVYLSEISKSLGQSAIQLSAQNVAEYDSGAYTGEISSGMLVDSGCQWCLVGHSERRTLFSETDSGVQNKVARLIEAGIRPILCVGETLEERESGRAQDVVAAQVNAVFSRFGEAQLERIVVAYEPVWAIGTGKTATPDQAQDMHKMIRSEVEKVSESLAQSLAILYGGSVNAANAKALFEKEDIDGGLVGGASLKVEDFAHICEQIG